MHITIQFDTANAAFEDDFEAEARSISKQVGKQIAAALEGQFKYSGLAFTSTKHVLRDSNGNLIGWIVTEALN